MAQFGELHPEIVAGADFKGPVRPSRCSSTRRRCPRPRRPRRGRSSCLGFQPLERDFAFIVDAEVEAEKLVRAARNADKALVTGVRVFDVYAGKGVPEGKKSVALTVTLQPVERTLTDAEIEAASAKIVAQVAKATGATLRG